MTGQEARDDEREALAADIHRVIPLLSDRGLDALHTSGGDACWVVADGLLAAGYRKHPEPEMEYEVTYSSANAPSVDGYALRRTSGVMTDLAKAREFAAVARNPMLRARTKGVPAGPWVPVGEGEQAE